VLAQFICQVGLESTKGAFCLRFKLAPATLSQEHSISYARLPSVDGVCWCSSLILVYRGSNRLGNYK